MAKIEKATYTKPIPGDAKIVTKDGRRFARFKHRGRTVEAPLTRDGRKCRVETDEWYVRYKNADGRWKRRKGYTDKQATEALTVRIQTKINRQQEGLTDPFEQQHRRPLTEHLAEFETVLVAKAVPDDEARDIAARAKKIIEGCRFEKIGDISASKVQAFVSELRKVIRRKKTVVDGGPLAPQTRNHYLQSIKQFTRWLVRDHRTDDNRLAHVPKFNVETDRRHDRRPLSVDEFRRLIDAATGGPSIETVAGPDRAVLYILAAWTGYRRKELGFLTVRSFDLDGDTRTVRVQAAYSKNKRTDEIPLHSAIVEPLRAWLAAKGMMEPDAPVFPLRTAGGHWRKTSKMMRLDLERAGLPYQDEDGLFADFHANRHTFISNLGKVKVPLSMMQKLARHSTPTLTSNVYTHLELSDKASAIESLPAAIAADDDNNREANVLQATGTDNNRAEAPPPEKGAKKLKRLPHTCKLPGTAGHKQARQGTEAPRAREREQSPQTVKLQRFGTAGHATAQVETSGREPPTPGLQSRCSPD